MDSFDELELLFSDTPMMAVLSSASESREDRDVMSDLVDADTRVGYGGYCVIT